MVSGHDPTLLPQSLPLEIKAATRERHHALNRLITPRVCLCLPPHTQTPQVYALGLSVFCSIYTSFECAWLRFLEYGETDNSRMVGILQLVHIPELVRHRSLEQELANFMTFNPHEAAPDGASATAEAYSRAITSSIRARPHTVLAYAWVMYMALFNGGRMIRDQLLSAPPAFWEGSKHASDAHEEIHIILQKRLPFWYLGSDDGTEMKEAFKQRFDVAAAQLTASERVDIVEEAVRIFDMLREMVDWLDTNTNAGLDANQESRDAHAKVGLHANADL